MHNSILGIFPKQVKEIVAESAPPGTAPPATRVSRVPLSAREGDEVVMEVGVARVSDRESSRKVTWWDPEGSPGTYVTVRSPLIAILVACTAM